MKFNKKFARVAIKFLTACSAVLLTSCSSLLYYPRYEKFYDPEKLGLTPEDIFFKDASGTELNGWWFESKIKPAKGTFIYFHGNAENLSSHFASMSWLPEQGYNYFIFDYPGYGQSDGSPGPKENVIAGQAAIRWVHDNKDASPLIVYGQSMGGIVAMRSVIEEKDKLPIKVMIADGTFSSFQRIARKKLATSWITWLLQPLAYVVLSDSWAPDVEKISPIPMIVMHGRQDPVVEFEHGERVFKDSGEPKQFIEVPEGKHGNLFWIEEGKYRRELLAKLESI